MNKKEIIVEKSKKISNLLEDYGFSFSDIQKILREKDVKINGKAIKENLIVNEGDVVTVFFSDNMLEKKYDKIYEDDDVVVAYKSQGIETDGEKGLEKILSAIAVHRLDRNTEGLVVFAKNDFSAKKLNSAFKNRKVDKFYVAEVVGEFDCKKTIFEAYLVKDSENSTVKIFKNRVPNSVLIKTGIETIKKNSSSSLLKIELLTGKTHQIRAHLAYLGHPIIGDGKYGKEKLNKKFGQSKQKLACYCMKFQDVGIEKLNGKNFERKPKWWI